MLPTLDTPIPPGKSAMWCASLQLAWNELKSIPGAVEMAGPANPVADRLNRAGNPTSDLPAGSYYARSGLIKDGVVDAIRKEMAERFPAMTFPDRAPDPGTLAMAYAYLAASVKFAIPFFDENSMRFRDSSGQETRVACFGLGVDRRGVPSESVRNQVAVLHYDDLREETEFILDPAKDTEPNQIILARIRPAETLAKMVNRIDKLMGEGEPAGEHEPLLIPNLSFMLEHHFAELEGSDKLLQAIQVVRFELNRSGAELESEARLHVLAKAVRRMVFDGPFLLMMKKRGAKNPFFVLWVDNAEILTPRS